MGKRVLIVDDDAYVRSLLIDIFENAGFEIAGVADDGSEVIDKYLDLKPDLITMDILMPQIDGVEAVKSILSVAPDAKIVMITAITQMETVRDCVKLGAKGYITKPFHIDDVINACERALME